MAVLAPPVPTDMNHLPYVATKTVLATPMTEREFLDLMVIGAVLADPQDESEVASTDQGFMVEVPEGATNHIGYSGHLSWVPSAEFLYRHQAIGNGVDEPAFLQRLRVEQIQLDQRLKDLMAFTKHDNFFNLVHKQRDLLLEQGRVMLQYSFILHERIAGHMAQIEHKKQAEANKAERAFSQ